MTAPLAALTFAYLPTAEGGKPVIPVRAHPAGARWRSFPPLWRLTSSSPVSRPRGPRPLAFRQARASAFSWLTAARAAPVRGVPTFLSFPRLMPLWTSCS